MVIVEPSWLYIGKAPTLYCGAAFTTWGITVPNVMATVEKARKKSSFDIPTCRTRYLSGGQNSGARTLAPD